MRGFRSPMLGALVALACTPSMEVARREDDVHHLFLRSVAVYAPDLDVAATVELLLADARAAQMVGGSYEHEALGIADDFEAWASGGRRPILIRDEAVAGEWRARIAFTGPGSYRAETYRNASTPGERGEVIVREAATRADAWRGAVEEAKARANAEIRARLFSPYPDDAAEPMTFDLAIKAGRQWLADCDPDAAGIILHLGTGTETVTTDPRFIAARAAGEIEHRGARSWFFARALVLREPGVIKSINLRNAIPSFEVAQPQVIDLNPAYESGAPMATIGIDGVPLAHVIFDRSNPPTPKLKFSDISTTRPPLEPSFDLNRALRQVRHTIGIDLASEPRYSAKPKPAKPPKGPEARAQQRERKAGRTAVKKRRGWS